MVHIIITIIVNITDKTPKIKRKNIQILSYNFLAIMYEL